MPSPLADIFRRAAELNRDDPRREGNTVALAEGREVLAVGDIHGHRANLTKVIAHADLPNHPQRRLILQEIVHAPPDARTGHDRSVDVLLRAARLKTAHPEGVLFLLANHDIAQVTGNEITKGGRRVCQGFAEGVAFACGDAADEVLEAIKEFLLSAPIAVRTPGGVVLCHTLPTPRRMDQAGRAIPAGPYDEQALHRGGAVYEWTWGRKQTPEQVRELADALDASFLVLGHKRIDAGHEFLGDRAVILTAEHDRGELLSFTSDEPLTVERAGEALRPLASLGRRP